MDNLIKGPSLAFGYAQAGMFPVLVSTDGTTSPMRPEGMPTVKPLNSTDLSIVQPLSGSGTFSIVCAERRVTARGVDRQGKPLNWACNIVGGDRLRLIVKEVSSASVVYSHSGVEYRLKLGSGSGSCRELIDGNIQLTPNKTGRLVMQFDTSGGK